MIRWLLLLVTAPLWLPWRLIGYLRWRARPRGALHLLLSGSLPDVPPQRGLLALLRRGARPDLIRLLDVLEVAAHDPKIESVLVQIERLECGLSRADELRAALARARAAGKKIIVHAEELGLAGYWIALGASSVRLSPAGSLDVSGIAMEFTLLKGLLDRAGVRAQLLSRGKYKSMREVFTEPDMSDANREMLASLVGALSSELASLVASARQKQPEAARAAIDAGPFRADEALARGLIDATQYWDELWSELGGDAGRVQRESEYRKRARRAHLWPQKAEVLGLVRISGNIRSGHDRPGPSGPRATGSHSLRRALRQLTKSRRVRALVVRVDSPGGSALASDVMWRELTVAAAKKPVFVSMVNVAASGGYFTSGIKGVSIWASPTTLTGSIGVVGGKFEVSRLLEKLGIKREAVVSGPRAGFHSPAQPWTPDELAKVERDIEASYRDFVGKMADARGMSFDELHAVAQGRVWTGRQAQDVKLVDHLGGLYEVERAVREKLELAPGTRLRFAVPASERTLRGGHEGDADGMLDALLAAFPDIREAIEPALDLSGDRLWALSLIQPRLRC